MSHFITLAPNRQAFSAQCQFPMKLFSSNDGNVSAMTPAEARRSELQHISSNSTGYHCVCVAEPVQLVVEREVFEYWMQNVPVAEAALCKDERDVPVQVIQEDIQNQYRVFDMLEEEALMSQPGILLSQGCRFPLSARTATFFIESYYALNTVFLRRLAGSKLFLKPLKTKVVKELGLHPDSCRRQLDNLRRVWNKVENDDGCDNALLIRSYFHLSEVLSQTYERFLFLASFRLSDRRLAAVPYDALDCVADIIMREWGEGNLLKVDIEFIDALKNMVKKLAQTSSSSPPVFENNLDEKDNTLFVGVKTIRLIRKAFNNLATIISKAQGLKEIFLHAFEIVQKQLQPMCKNKEREEIEQSLWQVLDREHNLVWNRFLRVAIPMVARLCQVQGPNKLGRINLPFKFSK